MAYDVNAGLNDISSLDPSTQNEYISSSSSSSTDINSSTTIIMEDSRTTGLSRLPRMNFSFRRPKSDVGSEGVRSSIRASNNGVKSADSSPKLGRSKSLRLPRSNHLKSHSSSSINPEFQIEEEEQLVTGVEYHPPRGRGTVSHHHHLPPPRARATSNASSSSSSHTTNPSSSSSRSTSPGGGGGGGGAGPGSNFSDRSSTEVGQEDYDRFQRRSKSFSSARRYPRGGGGTGSSATGSRLGVGGGLAKPSAIARSKTPTTITTSRLPGPSTTVTAAGSAPSCPTSSSSTSQQQGLSRTTSVGRVARYGTKTVQVPRSHTPQFVPQKHQVAAPPRSHTPQGTGPTYNRTHASVARSHAPQGSASHAPQGSTGHAPQAMASTSHQRQVSYESSSSTASSRRSSNKTDPDSRGKRPSVVVVMSNGGTDLDQVSAKLLESQGVDLSSETKTVVRSTTGKSKGAYHRGSTPSPTEKFIPVSSYAQSRAPTKKASYDESKLLKPSGEDKKASRPTSANAYYNGATRHGTESKSGGIMNRPNSMTNLEQRHREQERDERRSASRGSTPSSSGRSTPVKPAPHRSNSRTSLNTTDGGGVVFNPSAGGGGGGGGGGSKAVLPPRTPYRVARTKLGSTSSTGSGVGINELEGSVLLEAEDYHRISHDVKSLKTALLKLKREIQSDSTPATPAAGGGGTSTSTTPAAAAGATSSTPATSGSRVVRRAPAGTPGFTVTSADLHRKLHKITAEKDKALEETEALKKQLQAKNSRIDQLSKTVEESKKSYEKLQGEFKFLEGHRDRLLEKVELLHADKHKLDDRLTSLEKARFYEQSVSDGWLDDVDGGGVAKKKGAGPAGERKETESDIGEYQMSDGGEGESSEPESTAVCSAPIC